MLILRSVRSVFLLALILVLSGCPAIPVDQRPDTEINRSSQVLVISNGGTSSVELLPALERTSATIVTLRPGESTRLPFLLRLMENKSPGKEREIMLSDNDSSPFISQSAKDLVILARFNGQVKRKLRIKTGECIFNDGRKAAEHQLPLVTVPLPGVPVLDLCTN